MIRFEMLTVKFHVDADVSHSHIQPIVGGACNRHTMRKRIRIEGKTKDLMNFEFYPSSLCNGGDGHDAEPTYVIIIRLFVCLSFFFCGPF